MRRKSRRIKVQSAKAKGRAFQQKIRDLFRSVHYPSGRPVEAIDIESRQMSGAGEDVRFLTPVTQGLFPFYVEAKAHRRGFNPHQMMEKLEEMVGREKWRRWSLLFHKRDRGESLVTMRAELFRRLIQLYYSQKGVRDLREALERVR